MFIQDLYLLAFDSAEIRTPLLHLKGEIFRKGLSEWEPKFVLKCKNCEKEFQEKIERCDCGKSDLVGPDSNQIKYFENFRKSCNIFDQSFEDILQTLSDDVNICLVPGTLIRRASTPQGYTFIEEVKVGDKVFTHTGKGQKVLRTFKRFIDEDLIVIHLDNKETIKVTSNHPIYTTQNWVRAGKLTTKHVLYRLSDINGMGRNFMSNEERYIKFIIPSAIRRKGRKRGKYNYISPKKNRNWEIYYGTEKANEIRQKMKSTKKINESSIGSGFNFRAKVGTFKGINNPNWIDGRSFEPYGVEFNSELKRKIFIRDSFTCQLCMKYPVRRLVSHHIDYNKQNNDKNNLISLCTSCHTKTNYNRENWKKLFDTKAAEKNVLISNGTKILKIEKEHYKGFVYNLEVENDNSYVGKGIIFHNCDDAFIFLNKQYGWVDRKLWSRVIEIRRIHPALMELDLDKNGLPKNSHWLCPFHREETSIKPIKCKECKIDMVPAMYIYNHRGKRVYLYEDEVIHTSKFSPSETYGYSPLLTIMQKVLTLSGMDRFLYRYFFERKAPTGMILTYTDDPQSLELERARIESKMMEDPTYMPWVAVSSRTQRGRTDFVRLFHTLQEMDYLPVRNEIRDRVSAIYGVPQLYMNVIEGVGGISGETQQLKMFSNVIEADQKRYNENIFPIIFKSFGITDWKINLRAPEEKIESVIIQLAQQKVAIAAQMLQMGFDVELKPGTKTIEDVDFNFSGKAVSPQEMMGGMGAGVENPPLPEGLERSKDKPPHLEGQPHKFAPKEDNEERVFRDYEAEKRAKGKIG